jgi:hypothetical protein
MPLLSRGLGDTRRARPPRSAAALHAGSAKTTYQPQTRFIVAYSVWTMLLSRRLDIVVGSGYYKLWQRQRPTPACMPPPFK